MPICEKIIFALIVPLHTYSLPIHWHYQAATAIVKNVTLLSCSLRFV